VPPPRVVLASKSPQRSALLDALGLDFEVAEPAIEELTEGDPRELVLENARWKAAAVAATARPGTLVIAGDTEVAIDGEVLGQPEDEAEARSHLERLSGSDHEVLGGLALLGGGKEPRSGVEASTVTFRDLGPSLLEAYLASGEWRGRAGSYAIQGLGSALVAAVLGDVSNVIGLPVALLLRLAPELVSAE
jgi:septum formation protein